MLHVLATIEVAEGKRTAFLAEFHKLVPLVRAEDGCIEYGAAIDVPTAIPVQTPVRDDVVMVVEKWTTLDALERPPRRPAHGRVPSAGGRSGPKGCPANPSAGMTVMPGLPGSSGRRVWAGSLTRTAFATDSRCGT